MEGDILSTLNVFDTWEGYHEYIGQSVLVLTMIPQEIAFLIPVITNIACLCATLVDSPYIFLSQSQQFHVKSQSKQMICL